jgi:hypothetical protein
MSYTINVSGHSVTETPDEAKQLEEQALTAARTFVSGLKDATAATFQGQHTGFADLMAQPEQAQEPAA